ncbi:hypothetical protein RB600_005294 [Gaeumannomyces tritici]
MSSQKESSSKQAWRDNRTRILALAESHTVKDVEKIMWDEHRFKANQNQYEYHLRIWGFQKNVDTKQWRIILEAYDGLVVQHGEVQVLVRGEALSSTALQKRRRMYASQQGGSSTNAMSIPQIVSFQARGSDGQWTPVAEGGPSQEAGAHAGLAPQPEHISPRTSLAVYRLAASDDNLGPSQQPSEVPLSQAPGEDAITATDQPHTIYANDSSPAELAQPSQTQHVSPSASGSAALELFEPPGTRASSPRTPWLRRERPRILVRREHERLRSPCPQSAHEFLARLLEGVFSSIENGLRRSQIFQMFNLEGVSPTGLHRGCLTFAPDALLQPLQTLLPETRLGYINGDYSLNVRLFRRLVFALANADICLDSADDEQIIHVIGRSTGGATLFSQLLANTRGGYGLAIAESLLKSAIRAKNADAVRMITGTSAVDITKIRFEGGSDALHEAISSSAPSLLIAVLSSGYSEDATSRTHISYADWGKFPISEETVSVIMRLMPKSDSIRSFEVTKLFKDNPQLAYRVIMRMPPDGAVQWVCSATPGRYNEPPLNPLFHGLGEAQVADLVSHLMKGYSTQTTRGRYQDVISVKSINTSAKRGHTKVLQLLLPWAPLCVLLGASIRCGNRDLATFILSRQSEMEELLPGSSSCGPWCGYCDHPLARAILSRNDELIRLIEEARPSRAPHSPKHVLEVLRAAAAVGHDEYFLKLAHQEPRPSTEDLHNMLVKAIEGGHGNMNICLRLLQLGAATYKFQVKDRDKPTALSAAVRSRNRQMVEAILEHGCHTSQFTNLQNYDPTIWKSLIEWGDFDLIIKLKSAFPPLMVGTMALGITEKSLAQQGGPPDIIGEEAMQFLAENGLMDTFRLRIALETAIKLKKEKLARLAIELGADPVRRTVLEVATCRFPQFLPVLLEQVPRAVLENRAKFEVGYAQSAIQEAISQGPLGLPALKCLFDSGIASIHNKQDMSNNFGYAIANSKEAGKVDLTAVLFFLDLGYSPESIVHPGHSSEPITALALAIRKRNVALVELLVDRGATVNTALNSITLFTPLQEAAAAGSLDIVKLLLSKGADVNAAPAACAGGTALQMAAISGNCSVISELLEAGADIYMQPSQFEGRWPLEGAAEHGRISAIEFLWKWRRGCFDPKYCERAMELAEREGHMGCRQLIQELRGETMRDEAENWMAQGSAGFGPEDFSP